MYYSWVRKVYFGLFALFLFLIVVLLVFFTLKSVNLAGIFKINSQKKSVETVQNFQIKESDSKVTEPISEQKTETQPKNSVNTSITNSVKYVTLEVPFTVPSTQTRFSVLVSGLTNSSQFQIVIKNNDGRELNPDNSKDQGVIYAKGNGYILYNTNTYCKNYNVTGSWKIVITGPEGEKPKTQVASFKDC